MQCLVNIPSFDFICLKWIPPPQWTETRLHFKDNKRLIVQKYLFKVSDKGKRKSLVFIVDFVQSQQLKHQNNVRFVFKATVKTPKQPIDDVLMSLLLTLNRFYSLLNFNK